MTALPEALLRSLAAIVGEGHVLTGDATAGFAVDWTGRFQGRAAAVVRGGNEDPRAVRGPGQFRGPVLQPRE